MYKKDTVLIKGRYNLIKQIARGSFGIVYQGKILLNASKGY